MHVLFLTCDFGGEKGEGKRRDGPHLFALRSRPRKKRNFAPFLHYALLRLPERKGDGRSTRVYGFERESKGEKEEGGKREEPSAVYSLCLV